MNLTLLRYANYKNRIVRRPLSTTQDYVDEYGAEILLQLNDVYLWNPNDGIATSQVLDTYTDETADYLIVTDDYGEIESRWYVMDAIRTLKGQYQLSLLRDVIADNYNDVLGATCFVEKAMVSVGDPAIYNEEPFRTNQILTRKDFLYDETECPWIVAYIPKNYPSTEAGQTGNINFNYYPTPDLEVDDIKLWEKYSQLGTYLSNLSKDKLYVEVGYNSPSATKMGLRLEVTETAVAAVPYNPKQAQASVRFDSPFTFIDDYEGTFQAEFTNAPTFKNKISTKIAEIDAATAYSQLKTRVPYTTTDVFYGLVGKVIKDKKTGIYYTLQMKLDQQNFFGTITSISGPIWNTFAPVFNYGEDQTGAELKTQGINIAGPVYTETYSLVPVGAKGVCSITQNRIHLSDQPYDMLCIPYSDDIIFRREEGDKKIDTKFTKTMALAFAQDLATDLGSAAIYDIQMLPYCPVPYLMKKVGDKKIFEYRDLDCTYIEDGYGNPIAGIFWAFSSQFSFEIPYDITLPNSAIEQKLISVCDKYRICSPNMSSFFDFDPVKNNGVTTIEVDCYYKPHIPYIHLNPKFSGIYGGETGYEVRGLDLAGNFSLTQVSDAWTNYQLQIKNFQNIFNRQQENITTMREYERKEQIVGATVGALGAGVQTGLMTGNVYAGIGAAAVSGIAGGVDVAISEGKYKEVLDYNKTMYQYSLENIRALPQSLTKVDALSPNNPLIPYIEYYTCTDVEKGAIRNNLLYGGMTVGRIGSLGDFQNETPSFIKAQLIRIEGLKEDYHFADTISQELKLGVFI